KPARLKKTGGPSLQNFPMAHRPDFFRTGALLFLEHDPEKWVPVLRKDHAPTRSKCDNDYRTLAQCTKNRLLKLEPVPANRHYPSIAEVEAMLVERGMR